LPAFLSSSFFHGSQIPSSPLGLYVRRAQLEYRKLTFEDSTKLSAAFINYIMPIQTQDEKIFIESVSPGSSDLTVLANADVEKFLDGLISEYSSMWTTRLDAVVF